MKVTCLGSGSSGNSLLVQAGERALLVDAGLSATKLRLALEERGVPPGQLDAILITHEHADHVAGLRVFSRKHSAPVLANPSTLHHLLALAPKLETLPLHTGGTRSVGAFEVTSFPVSHDATEPVGYVIEAEGARITVATDLGRTSPEVLEAAREGDLVVLEANHDLEMLRWGPYPAYLKRRILSENGHLSNEQTAELICEALGTREQTFWLAHLSKTNNTKREAQEGVTGYLAAEGLRANVLVTERDRPSLVWHSHTPGF